MEDILKSLQQSLAERFSSPLLSSFLIAWAGWNYKFVMIVLSANTVTTTLDLIQRVAFPDWQAMLFRGAILPLASALLYILGYPYPARWVNGFVLRQQRANNKQRSQIEEETPLTLEESNALRAEFRARYRALEEELRKIEAEGARFREIASAAETRQSELISERDRLASDVKELTSRLASVDETFTQMRGQNSAIFETLRTENLRITEQALLDSKTAQLLVKALVVAQPGAVDNGVLAKKLKMDQASVSRLVQQMLKVGYLVAHDGQYELTEKGVLAFSVRPDDANAGLVPLDEISIKILLHLYRKAPNWIATPETVADSMALSTKLVAEKMMQMAANGQLSVERTSSAGAHYLLTPPGRSVAEHLLEAARRT